MIRRISYLFATTCISLHVGAQEISQQADSFANIYATMCLKHLSDLDALSKKLDSIPSLPAEKAQHFLQGKQGRAWPVPDKHGVFVLVIPTGKNFCAVFARKLNEKEAVSRFQKLVASAPYPLKARELERTGTQTKQSGKVGTLSYEWSMKDADKKMIFTLTTADSPDADIQGLASAAYVR